MRSPTTRQLLALFAALWTGGYLGLYFNTVSSQGSTPALWYLALLLVAIGLLVLAGTQPARTWAIAAAVVVLGLSTLVAILSVGVFLTPALLMAVLALVATPKGHR